MPFKRRLGTEGIGQKTDKNYQIVAGTDGKSPAAETETKLEPTEPGTYERVFADIRAGTPIDRKALMERLKEKEKMLEERGKRLVIDEPKGRERFSRGWVIAGSAALAASLVAVALVLGGEANKQSTSAATIPVASSPKPPKSQDAVKPVISESVQEDLPTIQPIQPFIQEIDESADYAMT